MVFSCENHLQLARISFFTTLFIFSWVAMGNTGGPQNIAMGLQFFNSLPWVAWNVFVLGGHGIHMWKPFATCTNLLFRYFIFVSWGGMEITGGPLNSTMGLDSFNSLPLIAWVVFVLRGHGFHMWKPFATWTYCFFHYFIFFSLIGMGNNGVP